MENVKKWMTVKEAQEFLMVSQRTIYNYFERGLLTEYRSPEDDGPVRLLREEVENFFRPSASNDQKNIGRIPE